MNKREMEIIRNLARAQRTPVVEETELVNEAVMAVLEEKRAVGIANDGILIAIAKRAMINYKLHLYVPASVPKGSRYAVYKKKKGTRGSLEEVDAKPNVRHARKKMDFNLAVKQGVDEMEEMLDKRIVKALVEGWTIEEMFDILEGVSVHAVLKTKKEARKIFNRLGFKG